VNLEPAILSAEDFVDWKDASRGPDLVVLDKTPDEDESEPPEHETVEKETNARDLIGRT